MIAIQSETLKAIEIYQEQLVGSLRKIMGENLIGLYVYGSIFFEDFQDAHSDIDLIAISSSRLKETEKKRLTKELNHNTLSCPVAGLDFYLLSKRTATHPSGFPKYEMYLTTGADWEFKADYNDYEMDLLINMTLCRDHGIKLFGIPEKNLFTPIPRPMLLQALKKSLSWRQHHILDPFHDPNGENAVLNACRAWRYHEENIFCSKTAAGRWALNHTNEKKLIQEALYIRHGISQTTLDRKEVRSFVRKIKYSLGTNVFHRIIYWLLYHNCPLLTCK